MATYTFRNKETNEVFDHSMRMSEYDSYMESNPSVERYYLPGDAMNIVSGVGGIKTDNGFKEVLSKVAEAHPNSNLADRTLSRSVREHQIDRVVNKYRSN
jgi:hypothetical protein